jgi:uncharacterized membrane protein
MAATPTSDVSPAVPRSTPRGRSIGVGALLGVGLMGAIDEIVFHQLLHWHHLDDRSTLARGLVSDGLLHSATLTAAVVALLLFAELLRSGRLDREAWAGGILVGMGGFQLADGLVNHKLLELHQIRYGVDLLPYDIAWNAAGALLLLAGLGVLARGRRRAVRPE